MTLDASLLGWLLDSDPALRWQVERDLVGASPDTWRRRERALRSKDSGQPCWRSRMRTASGPGVRTSRRASSTAPRQGEVDVCINSFTLATGAWLGADVSAIAAWFPANRQDDGGWNCEASEGNSVRSSFHSTLNALRGMLAYERFTGDSSLRPERRSGEEYLLSRRLMYRSTTGEIVGDFVTQFLYPNRHRYSVLFALDYFRESSLFEGTPPDPRLAEALEVVRSSRQPDGTWLQSARLAGRTWFDIDVAEGEPSPWLTLMGTRVLDWWHARVLPGE